MSLTPDSEFTVGEEKVLNYIMAVILFALFTYGVVDAARRNFHHIDYQSYIFALAVIPAILILRRANSGRVYLRVNKKGIYQDEKMVTPWSHFNRAYLTQKKKTNVVSIQDNFQLVVEHKSDKTPGLIKRRIALTNTQNKSEEDVMAAIRYFLSYYRQNQGIGTFK